MKNVLYVRSVNRKYETAENMRKPIYFFLINHIVVKSLVL